MESEHAKETNEHVRKNPEYKDGNILLPQENIPIFSSSSFSSSSSSSSSSDFGIHEKDPFDISSSKSKSDENPLSDPESVSSPDTKTHTPSWSMLSTSPPTGPTEYSSPENSTRPQMKSPPIQTMGGGQPAGYDPNRIPSSVFSTKATNPSEWSVASNESLFSIHMGNNSFSRDVGIMFGKSGELPKLEEYSSNPHSNISLPPVIEVPAHEESCANSDKVVVSRLEKQDSDDSSKRAKMEFHAEEKKACCNSNEVVHLPPIAMKVPESKAASPPSEHSNITLSNTPGTSTSNPRLSDESGNSSSSFAFPVLVSDGGKTGSLKKVEEKPEKPELQEQVSKAYMTRWFSWFSCWPRCC